MLVLFDAVHTHPHMDLENDQQAHHDHRRQNQHDFHDEGEGVEGVGGLSGRVIHFDSCEVGRLSGCSLVDGGFLRLLKLEKDEA